MNAPYLSARFYTSALIATPCLGLFLAMDNLWISRGLHPKIALHDLTVLSGPCCLPRT
jgi:hypothetical protein